MQQLPTFAGIDISKLTLDICLIHNNTKQHYKINNTIASIKSFFNTLEPANLHIGMENTGCYNYYLYEVLTELGLAYYVIPPLHLKKSLGLSRGKNDKVDAVRIALFLEANLNHLSAYKPPRAAIIQLQLLLTARSQRIKIRKQIANGKEQYQYLPVAAEPLEQLDKELLTSLDQQIKTIEVKIQTLIDNDTRMSACYKLISSV